MTFSETCDVVVLGSGAAGSSAALAAAAHGLKVILLEKEPVLGGGTAYSYGVVWLGLDPYAPPESEKDRRHETDLAVEYLTFLCAGTVPRDDLERFVHRSGWAARLLRGHGVTLKPSAFVPDHYYPVAPGSKQVGRVYATPLFKTKSLDRFSDSLGLSPYVPTGLTWDEAISWGGLTDDTNWNRELVEARREYDDQRGFGMSLAGHLLLACMNTGVDIRRGCEAKQLIIENGKVVGVEACGQDATLRIEAKRGVVIATGGVEGNHDFVKKFEDLPAWHTHFPPGVTGDGVLMALNIGASLTRSAHNLRVMLGYKLATPENGRSFRSAGVREAAAPHTLVVNYRGERFGDESSFQYMVNEIKKLDVGTHAFVNYPCYLIMDSQFFAQYSFAGRPKGAPAPVWVARDETLEGLARKLNIADAPFERTVAAFNGFAKNGEDLQFGRGGAPFANVMGGTRKSGNANLGSVEKPPFYGVPLIPTGMCSVTLQISADGAVLDNYGAKIVDLYACGNAARDIDSGPGYQAGISHAQAIAMGCTIGVRLAGGMVP